MEGLTMRSRDFVVGTASTDLGLVFIGRGGGEIDADRSEPTASKAELEKEERGTEDAGRLGTTGSKAELEKKEQRPEAAEVFFFVVDVGTTVPTEFGLGFNAA